MFMSLFIALKNLLVFIIIFRQIILLLRLFFTIDSLCFHLKPRKCILIFKVLDFYLVLLYNFNKTLYINKYF